MRFLYLKLEQRLKQTNWIRIMKHLLILLFSFSLLNSYSQGYQKYFTKKRYRLDYRISGDYKKQEINSLGVTVEKKWGGSRVNLIDTFGYGKYMLKIYDKETNRLLYSRGFSDLFAEWQTTSLAKEKKQGFSQSILFPAPRKTVSLEILRRDSTLTFRPLYTMEIDPQLEEISKQNILETEHLVLHRGANSNKALDLIMLSEGYKAAEKEKFFNDAERFKEYLLDRELYKEKEKHINVHAVYAASEQTGVDIPGDSLYVNTILDAHFNTFGVERYLTLPDLTKVYDYLSEYPVDQVVVIVNSDKYGGGGIYNFYNIFTSDNEQGEMLFMHEFGHGFASLADEYFNSKVAYEETGSMKYEPYEPNITNLVDFEKKWQGMINDSVPVPTPDSIKYRNVVGVFEGANYLPKGFYRPYFNCIMRSLSAGEFCPVCEKSIKEMLDWYSK